MWTEIVSIIAVLISGGIVIFEVFFRYKLLQTNNKKENYKAFFASFGEYKARGAGYYSQMLLKNLNVAQLGASDQVVWELCKLDKLLTKSPIYNFEIQEQYEKCVKVINAELRIKKVRKNRAQ